MNHPRACFLRRAARLAMVAALACTASACVYRMNIQQGNYLDPKAIEQLQTGMTRSQVRYLLGTPMVPDAFDRERWDYLYFLKTKRLGKPERRLLTVYFEGDKVARFERQGLPPPASAPTARPGSADAVEAHGAGMAAPSS
ncbi:MAG: outer membrane protein assembly factor BamE [Gammaproteobacteria bacterium]|nr:outer membrane protein assembly factor BamE [Gammaproteobacteria bacterium]